MRLVLVWRGDPAGYGWAPPPLHTVMSWSHSTIWQCRTSELRLCGTTTFGPGRIGTMTSGASSGPSSRCSIAPCWRACRSADAGWRTSSSTASGSTWHTWSVDGPPQVRRRTARWSWPSGAAVAIGAHVALGLEPPDLPYRPDHSPTWQSSLPRRLVGNGSAHAAACVPRGGDVRIAAAANFKVTPALAALAPANSAVSVSRRCRCPASTRGRTSAPPRAAECRSFVRFPRSRSAAASPSNSQVKWSSPPAARDLTARSAMSQRAWPGLRGHSCGRRSELHEHSSASAVCAHSCCPRCSRAPPVYSRRGPRAWHQDRGVAARPVCASQVRRAGPRRRHGADLGRWCCRADT